MATPALIPTRGGGPAPNVPQVNPTGSQGWGGSMPTAPVWNPTGGPGNYNFGNTMNPFPAGGSTGTPVMNPPVTGPLPVGVPSSGVVQDPTKTANELGKIYGPGIGGLLESMIQSQGGYNSALTQQAVQAELEAMRQNINIGYGNLTTQMGATGISPQSSVAALETSNYFSNAITQENAITAQQYFDMWQESQQREFGLVENILGGAQAHRANKPGILGTLSNIFNLGTGIASSVGTAASAGGAGTWADILAGLG